MLNPKQILRVAIVATLLGLSFVAAAFAQGNIGAQGYYPGVTAPVFGSPTFTGQVKGAPGTCAAGPTYSATGALTTGFNITVTPSGQVCVNGVLIATFAAGSLTSTVPYRGPNSATVPMLSNDGLTGWGIGAGGLPSVIYNAALLAQFNNFILQFLNDSAAISFGSSSDVTIGRGALNRLDLATGDSFHMVSGGLGVGVVNTVAGTIVASSNIDSGGRFLAPSSGYFGWNARSLLRSTVDGKTTVSTADETAGILIDQFTNNPTCATNCGTSPTLSGVDGSFTLTMGATGVPASNFVITFNTAWLAAPQCHGTMGLAGMLVTKLPIVVATTTTTATVTTNGTAPANGDIYHFHCRLGQ